MALGFKARDKDGIYYLEGSIDELADFSQFLRAPPPLRINFRGIRSVNSLGTRQVSTFMSAWGTRPMELFECTTPVLEMFNTFPSTLGSPYSPERVQSFYVTYVCGSCDNEAELLVRVSELSLRRDRIPQKSCPRCGGPAEIYGEPEDYLLFLISGS